MKQRIEVVTQRMAEQDALVRKLDRQIVSAEGELGKDGPDKTHWQATVQLLRQEKGVQLAELLRLRGEEANLWASLHASTGRRAAAADAGPSQDVDMEDVAQEDCRRRSNEDPWNDKVDKDVGEILKRAFVSPEGNGQPQLNIQEPSPNNPRARRDASAVYYRNRPSLLLTSLPEQDEDGRTNARQLLAKNDELHASGHGQHQVQTRSTALIAPSGAGKTRTGLEALCHRYGFYFSFSNEKEPGTRLLQAAIKRLWEKHKDEYLEAWRAASGGDASRLQAFRENMSREMEKFISRILLAYALGLLAYLNQHRDQANPKGFLLFQLIGIVDQEDWLLNIWGCLLSLSREVTEKKLQTIVQELRSRTGQEYFNVFLDEAQVGTRELAGYFPNRDNTQGRPLLNGLVRKLGEPVFASFHFNLTGTGLSLRHAQQLETAVGEVGAAQLEAFTDFTRFTAEDVLQYAQEYLQSPPDGIKGDILVGRPRFAAQLVQEVLLSGKTWEEALDDIETLHTKQKVATSLLRGLYEKKELPSDVFQKLVEELRCLLLGYYIIGKGVPAGETEVDMIEVGVCHLAYLGRPGESTLVMLDEPLAAGAVKSFLAEVAHWDVNKQGLSMLRTSPRVEDLPSCFYGQARVECHNGTSVRELDKTEDPRVQTFKRGRGLIEFVREPAGFSFFFPEEEAGPDCAAFVRIGEERWFVILQAKCRKKVPNRAHMLGSVNIRTMFGSNAGPAAKAKRKELTDLLKQRQVTGILRIVLAYPAEVKTSTHVEASLRRSERLPAQEGDEFASVQVGISKANGKHFLQPTERKHLDCLKDLKAPKAASVQGG